MTADIPGGSPRPTVRPNRPAQLADVAALAGVSPGLASRILRDVGGVRARQQTRERIRDAAAKLNYTPDQAAQALRRRSAGALGLVVHDVGNPIYAEIIRGAQDAASRAGIAISLFDADAIDTDPESLRAVLAPGRVDGVLLQAGGYDSDQQLISKLVGHVPVVLLNSLPNGGAPAVYLDEERVATVATEHLLDLGHRRLAFLGGRSTSRTAQLRRQAFDDCVLAAGGVPLPAIESGWDMAAGRSALTHLMARSHERPTAVVVANTLVAAGVLAQARAEGLSLPSDLSVVSIHDVWLAEATWPALTVVSTPLAEMGSKAVETLLATSETFAPESSQVTHPRPELVVRQSSVPCVDCTT